MALRDYRRKRHFDRTPEPAGQQRPTSEADRTYVIQKHAASRLHYDLRLEDRGVLKSWAVPKGPSYDPQTKRLAVEVEDHPVEYAEFEGIIPEGEYGAGTVLIWDRGRWIPQGDPGAGLRKGVLKFELEGEKLRGGWALVRMPREDHGKPQWLLIKEHDAEADRYRDHDIVAERPESVVSHRDLQAVARSERRVWHSNRPSTGATRSGRAGAPDRGTRAALPQRSVPQLATLKSDPPVGDEWLHEIKFDGYRILCRKSDDDVRLLSRSGQDWTAQFPRIADAVRRLPPSSAILDGEVVALEPDGRSSFQRLQRALSEGRTDELLYYVFDLLYVDDRDLMSEPLEDRKRVLRDVLAAAPDGPLRYTDHVVGDAADVLREACRLGLEGIISKRRTAPYREGRSLDWQKIKCSRRQEFVIGGYTDPSGARSGLGALLLGVYEKEGLRYVGKVGTGFTDKLLADLARRLGRLEQPTSPFLRRSPGVPRRAHWVRPELVGEVSFTEWTSDGRLRHPSFQGLRADKRAEDIVREEAEPNMPTAAARRPTPRSRPATSPSRGGSPETTRIAGVSVTNPDRVLYPEQGLTKLELARYYEAIGPRMLPHIANRPLMILRCPEGHTRTCFHQKHTKEFLPDAVRSVDVAEESGKKSRHVMVDDLSGLISLVQMGVLEVHVWGARGDDLEHPDRLVFDLDPDETLPWSSIADGARRVRARLLELGLQSWVKTTGGKGLHVVVPLTRRQDWDDIKTFAEDVANALVVEDRDRYTSKMAKAGRRGKIFIDYLRNARGATAVAAYSTRARPHAPVSLPISWEELDDVRGAQFTVRNVPERLANLKRDPWAEFWTTRQSLTRDMRRRAAQWSMER